MPEEKAMSDVPKPVEVFLSYAEEDESLCLDLVKHLSQLSHEGSLVLWHRRQIVAGTDWNKEIDEHLERASVILLLISANFMASKYGDGGEMQRAMRRHEEGSARVIPILLRPCDWQNAS